MTGRSLEDRLGERRAETWKPAPGELVIGTLEEVRWLVSSYDGRDYPLLVLRAEPDGRAVGVHVLHQVLRDELRAQRPRIGERIGIRYLGRVDNRYEGYKLAIDRDAPTDVSWEGPDTPAPPAATRPTPAQARQAPAAPEPEDIPF